MSKDERTYTLVKILPQKKIAWDGGRKTFLYRGSAPSLDAFLDGGHCHVDVIPLAKWCRSCLFDLRSMSQALDIAELLENMLQRVVDAQLSDEPAVRQSRRALHTLLVYEAAAIIKAKDEIELPPENNRRITADTFKVFTNEVFLKQQLLGYKFCALPRRQLKRMTHAAVTQCIRKEQEQRKLEIVQTSRYIFALSNVIDGNANAFSARRFLLEDRFAQYVYLNGAFIDNQHLESQAHINALQKQIDCILSIGGCSQAIIDFVEEMETQYENIIFPLLFNPLDSADMSLDKAVVRRIGLYEEALVRDILHPFKDAVLRLAGTVDDFKYLFIGLTSIFREVILDFSQWQTLPAVRGSVAAEQFMLRLIAHIQLFVELRKDFLSKDAVENWKESRSESANAFDETVSILEDGKKVLDKKKTNILIFKKMLDQEPTWFEKLRNVLFKREIKLRKRLQDLQQDFQKEQFAICKDIRKHVKDSKPFMNYIDHASILMLPNVQHYSVSSYAGMLDALPALLVLPENYREFNPDACLRVLLNLEKNVWREVA